MATITGTAGNDVLQGTTSNDVISGLAGNDVIRGAGGVDTLLGGTGDDNFYSSNSNETIDGGDGFDALSYIDSTSAVYVNTTTGVSSGGGGNDRITNIENFEGTLYNDTIIGSDKSEIFTPREGNDTVSAGGGDDYIFAHNGGDDTLDGGAGNDMLEYNYLVNPVIVDLAMGVAWHGNFTEMLTNFETIGGSSNYGDRIIGANANETLLGRGGDDKLEGSGGRDALDGGAGDDSLTGGVGDDVLDGGDGNDIAEYTGVIAEYLIVYEAGTKSFTITDTINNRDGADYVTNIESFSFGGVTKTVSDLISQQTPITGGVVIADFKFYDEANGISVTSNGNIIVSGMSFDELQTGDFILVSYDTNGSLNSGFYRNGRVSTDFNGSEFSQGMTLQRDGKILVAGYNSNPLVKPDFAVARYNANGTLDFSFDVDGKVTTDVGASDYAESVLQQLDGKIVVAGSSGTFQSENGALAHDVALIRYNTNGGIDSTFGNNGKVTNHLGVGWSEGYSLVQQNDGKLLLAGTQGYTSTGIALLRYNSNGSLDLSFGNGGIAEWAFGRGFATALQQDGKILVVGDNGNYGAAGDGFLLVRFNTNGTIDTSFNGGKAVVTDIGAGSDVGHSIVIQPDGKILVAGTSTNGSNSDIALVRYNSNGSLDITFDTDGKVVTDISNQDSANAIALQQDGKILVAGSSNNNIALLRYNSDGSLDETFNDFGIGPENENLIGTTESNSFVGGTGDDYIDGGSNIDYAVYSLGKDSYILKINENGCVVKSNVGTDGTDTLTNIERLQFSDKKIALDLTSDGNAGKSLEFIGMLANGLVNTPAIVGTILSIFDQGKSMKEVCQLAIDVGLTGQLAGSTSNLDLAKLVFRNVVGSEANAATANELAGYIQGNGGTMTQADFLATIAQLDLNNQHIGLIGLQQTGVEYIV